MMVNTLILLIISVYSVPFNHAYSTSQHFSKYPATVVPTTPSELSDLQSDLSTMNPDKVTDVKQTETTTRRIMERRKGGPSGGGGGGDGGPIFTIKMGGGGVTDAETLTDAPAVGNRLTIPPLPRPTTNNPTPTLTRVPSTRRWTTKPSTGQSGTETAETPTSPHSPGGLSTTAAFMVGLGLGISAFLLFSVLVLVLYCRYMQMKTNAYGIQSGAESVSVREPSQYMQLGVPGSPARDTFASGLTAPTYHTYEEAGPSGPPMPLSSPPVPSRVPENRYSVAPSEEIILSPDGTVAYRPSPSSQVIADTLSRMTRAVSQHSVGPSLDEDEFSSSFRPRCATMPAIGYEALNVTRRQTRIGKDGYAEYVDDSKKTDPESYTKLNSRPNSEVIETKGTEIKGTYAKNKKSKKPDNYTDLIIDQKEPDGYAQYNAPVQSPKDSSTDLRTGQNRRLPATPPEETDVHAVLKGMSKRQRHASMGSVCSLGTIPEDDKHSIKSENELLEVRTLDRVLSSRSDDSTYTNPNDDPMDDDAESLNYEKVDPNTMNDSTTYTPSAAVYLDMDEFYEGDECKLQSDLCLEDRKVFKFDKHPDPSPYYFKVDTPYYASPQKGINKRKESDESQDENLEDTNSVVSPQSEDQYSQLTSPIYTKVDDSASKSAQFDDKNNVDNNPKSTDEPPTHNVPGTPVYLDMDEFYEADECKLKSDLCMNPDLEDREVFKFDNHPPPSPYYFKVDTPYYASSNKNSEDEHPDGIDTSASDDRQYFQIQNTSPIYTKVNDPTSDSTRCEDNNNDSGDLFMEDKAKESESDNHIYCRVQSLRKKQEQDTNHVLGQKKRSFSEPAYFQLEKQSDLCEKATSAEISSIRDTKECPISNEDKQSEHCEGKYKRKTSLPLPNERNADYQHLVRSVTLPPISESQTYQQLNRGFKM